MTDIKDTLAALDVPGHLADAMRDVFLRYGKTVLSFDDSTRMADAAFAAYRSGQLVPVPSVEVVARAIYEADDPWHIAFPWPNPDGLGMAERYREIATAVRAALAGEQ